MQVDGRIGPAPGELRAVLATRAGASSRSDVPVSAPERAAQSAPERGRSEALAVATSPAAQSADEPRGRLTVHGLELAFDPVRDHELDVLERWREARVDAERRTALEHEGFDARTLADERAERTRALAAYEQALDEVRADAAGAGPADDASAPPSAPPSSPPSSQPSLQPGPQASASSPSATTTAAGASAAPDQRDAARPALTQAREPKQPTPTPRPSGYLDVPVLGGLVVDLSV